MKEFPVPKPCGEPTADGDIAAGFMRQWYEANRESWWERRRTLFHEPDRSGVHADEFMLRWMGQYDRLLREWKK